MGKDPARHKAIRGPGQQPSSGEIVATHLGERGLCVHQGGPYWDPQHLTGSHAGATALCEVTVPTQNTGLGPEKISFFQALGITVKISRGTTEILSVLQLIKTGDKVGASEATSLNTLSIPPSPLG
ncbi:hypothetical protein CB1_000590029 [Camelus ferus]|nr:hypothetical protein CB1_000590029 [Camelus ferus]